MYFYNWMDVNWLRKRTSFSLNNLRSFTWYVSMVMRSTPIPNANPVYLLLSMPQFSSTLG